MTHWVCVGGIFLNLVTMSTRDVWFCVDGGTATFVDVPVAGISVAGFKKYVKVEQAVDLGKIDANRLEVSVVVCFFGF